MNPAETIIALGTDHAGYQHKEAIRTLLESSGYQVLDFGAHSDQSSDYPDFVRPAAEAVAAGKAHFGVVLGGSGNGEAIVANKVRGIRCGLCWNAWSVDMTRKHNNANVMALGARVVDVDEARELVKQFLNTEFEGGRHQRRVEKIEPSLPGLP